MNTKYFLPSINVYWIFQQCKFVQTEVGVCFVLFWSSGKNCTPSRKVTSLTWRPLKSIWAASTSHLYLTALGAVKFRKNFHAQMQTSDYCLLTPSVPRNKQFIHWMSTIISRIPFISPICYRWGITMTSNKLHMEHVMLLTKSIPGFQQHWQKHWLHERSERFEKVSTLIGSLGRLNAINWRQRTGPRAQRVVTA